jgi:hypothetical protein
MLATAKPKMVKAIINCADKDLVHCLCECAFNVLKGNVPLTNAQKVKLKRYKQHLRALVHKKRANKKKILQTGGFLPALLAPIAASVIGPVLGSLLSR